MNKRDEELLKRTKDNFFLEKDNYNHSVLKNNKKAIDHFSLFLCYFIIDMLYEVRDKPDDYWLLQQTGNSMWVPVSVSVKDSDTQKRVYYTTPEFFFEESKEHILSFHEENKKKEVDAEYELNELLRSVIQKRVVGNLHLTHLTFQIPYSIQIKNPEKWLTPRFRVVMQSDNRCTFNVNYVPKYIAEMLPLLTRRCRARLHKAFLRYHLRPTPAKKEQLWGLANRYLGIKFHFSALHKRITRTSRGTEPDLSSFVGLYSKRKYPDYQTASAKYASRKTPGYFY